MSARDGGELLVGVDPHGLNLVGGDRTDPMTPGRQDLDDIGEVELRLAVVVRHLGQRLLEHGPVEGVDRRVDLVDGELGLVGITVFNDADHRIPVAQHPPVSARIRRPGGEHRRRSRGRFMVVEQALQRTRREKGHVSGEHEHGAGTIRQTGQTHLNRIGRTSLLGLEHRPPPALDQRSNGVGLMAHHDDGLLGVKRRNGFEHPRQEGATGRDMEDLRQVGLHSGSLAGGKDDGANAHSSVWVCGWGDRTRTRTGWTKTTCAASYTTPQERDGRAVYPRATPASPPCGGLPCARLRPMAGS